MRQAILAASWPLDQRRILQRCGYRIFDMAAIDAGMPLIFVKLGARNASRAACARRVAQCHFRGCWRFRRTPELGDVSRIVGVISAIIGASALRP